MKLSPAPYNKTVYVWNSVSAFFMYGPVTPLHNHNTLQLAFGLLEHFRCRTENTGWQLYKAVAIQADALHQFDPCGGMHLLLYLDAESAMAKQIQRRYLNGESIASLDVDIRDVIKPGLLESCLANPNPDVMGRLVQQLLQQLTGLQPPAVYDDRVRQVMALLVAGGAEKPTIAQLARQIFLSESRLRSLFKQQTGVPLHRYILWSSLVRGVQMMVNGGTVAEAALAAGFTDTSHFHKTLLQMFGVNPSQFIKNNSQNNILLLSPLPMALETRFYNEVTGRADQVYALDHTGPGK
jgi:AraC-like DNA-binding protein